VLALLKRYRELLLVAVLVLFPLAVFFAHAKRPAERSRVDQLILSATAPIEKILSLTITGTLDAWHGYLGLRGAHQRAMAISQENNRLKLELLRSDKPQKSLDHLVQAPDFARDDIDMFACAVHFKIFPIFAD